MSTQSTRYPISMRYPIGRTVLSGALFVALLAYIGIADANASGTMLEQESKRSVAVRSFDIPKQPAGAALNQLAEQADITLVFSSKLVSGALTNPVKGSYSISDALRIMLEGTSLSYQRISDSTIAINRKTDTTVSSTKDAKALKLVQTAEEQSTQSSRGITPEPSEKIQGSAATSPEITELDTVVVTGTNIRGIENNTVPVMSFSSEAIDNSGRVSTQDFLRALPQNFSGGSSGATEDGAFGVGSARGETMLSGINSVNLRGLGESSTLVLLNGHRLSLSSIGSYADISLIPLSALERIDILTDGASAVYGTDAVSGVVNFITKRNYDGEETRIRYGSVTSGDRRDVLAAQTFGGSWKDGSVLLSLQYQDQSALDARYRPNVASNLVAPSDLFPSNTTYSGFISLNQDIGASTSVYGDVLFTRRDFMRNFSTIYNSSKYDSENTGSVLNFGGEHTLNRNWSISTNGQYGFNKSIGTQVYKPAAGAPVHGHTTSRSEAWSVESILNGELFRLRMADDSIRLAVGASFRREKLDITDTFFVTTVSSSEREVSSGFTELYVPIVGPSKAIPYVRQVDLSLAARYDKYSDFGSTANPRFGIHWSPFESLHIRGSYSKSFRAPSLLNVAQAGMYYSIYTDFLEAPGVGLVPTLQRGGFEHMRPERATSTALGFDYSPKWLPGLRLSAGYYDIQYRDRIAVGRYRADALFLRDVFGPLIVDIPDDAAAQRIVDDAVAEGALFTDYIGAGVSGIRYLYDIRTRNASTLDQSGFDVAISYSKNIGEGLLSFSTNATVIQKIRTALASGATAIDVLNTYSNPVGNRLRTDVNWNQNNWTLGAAVNYVDSYKNTSVIPSTGISSWTTFDLNMRFSIAQNTELLLNAQNVFNRSPPFAGGSVATGVSYDVANASPLGRFLFVELRHHW